MDSLPRSVYELLKRPDKVGELLGFINALTQARVATASGDVPLLHQRGARNAVFDLRNINARGEPATGGGGGGLGDVVGPAGAVDGNVPVFDGATGKLIADSGVSIADLVGGQVASEGFTWMSRSTAMTVPDGSGLTAADFDNVISNDYGVWSASNPTRFTFPNSGTWLLYSSITYQIDPNAMRMNLIRANGAQTIGIQAVQAVDYFGGLATIVSLSTFSHFLAGEYVELCAQQWSGGILNALALEMRCVRLDTSAGGGGGGSGDFNKIVTSGGEVVVSGGNVVFLSP